MISWSLGGGVVHLKEKEKEKEKESSRTPAVMGISKSSVSEQWKPPPGRRSPTVGDYKSSTSEPWKLHRSSLKLPSSASSNTTSSSTQHLPTSPARASRPRGHPPIIGRLFGSSYLQPFLHPVSNGPWASSIMSYSQ